MSHTLTFDPEKTVEWSIVKTVLETPMGSVIGGVIQLRYDGHVYHHVDNMRFIDVESGEVVKFEMPDLEMEKNNDDGH